jgi:hypothetical protein
MSVTYDVDVTREGKWWMVSIPALDGLTQAYNLSEVEAMARSYIAVSQNADPDQIEVNVRVKVVGDVIHVDRRLAAIVDMRRQAATLEREATREAAGLARDLKAQGVSLRDIGSILGLSHQRVHQLVTA